MRDNLGVSRILQFPQQFTKHFPNSYIIWSSKVPCGVKVGVWGDWFVLWGGGGVGVVNPHLEHERN